jgi:hypothetical protein
LKICIAGDDIASQFKDLRKAFEKNGVKVCTYVHRRSESVIIKQDQYDYVGIEKLPVFFIKLSKILQSDDNKFFNLLNFYLTKHLIYFNNRRLLRKISDDTDIFLFIWSSFWSNYSDLKYLKRRGKKIAFIFCGDDARWYWAMKQDFQEAGLEVVQYPKEYKYGVIGLIERLKRIRMAEKYADLIFSKREQSQLQLRPFFHYPMSIDLSLFTESNKQQRKIPVIIHTPSDLTVKGTNYVTEALDKLQSEGILFEKLIINNKSHSEVLELLKNADIMIDQLFLPGGGKASSEALASGCIVLSNMSYTNYPQGHFFDGCPIIDVNIHNLYYELKRIILDHSERIRLAPLGPMFAHSHLDVDFIVNKMLKIFKGDKVDFDYIPVFFRNRYKPENFVSRVIYNRYNTFVKHENWYKQYIKHGKHNDLVF